MDVYVNQILEGDGNSSPQASDTLLDSELTLDIAKQLATELETRLQLCKTDIRQSLLTNHGTYLSSIDEVEKAQESISQLLHGVDELQMLFGDEETGIRARVIDAIEAESQAQEQFRGNTAVLQCLQVLSSLNNELEAMDNLVKSNKLSDAANAITNVEKFLADASIIEETRIEAVLNERIFMAKLNVKENVFRDLWKLVSIHTDDSIAHIRIGVADEQHPSECIRSLHSALDTLNNGSELQSVFSDRFIRGFVAPILSAPEINYESKNDTSSGEASKQEMEFSVSLGKGSDKVTSASDVCDVLIEAISFVNKALCSADNKSLVLWADGCATKIAALVLERCFLRCIPTTRKALEGFRQQIDVLVAFEGKLFDELYKTPQPDPKRSTESTEQRPISEKASQIGNLFAKRRCDEAFSQVRSLAESSSFSAYCMEQHEIWSLELVKGLAADPDCEPSPALAKVATNLVSNCKSDEVMSTIIFPRCTISTSIRSVVSAAYRLVNEGTLSSESAYLSLEFFDTARCLFDIYRALFLTLHRSQLTKVPALGWQFFNDCMYAAHHAGILGKIVSLLLEMQNVPENVMPVTFIDSSKDTGEGWKTTARLFFSVGSTHVASIVQQETDELKGLACSNKGNDAFYGASGSTKKAQLAKMVNQVRLSVTRLTRAIRPPAVVPHLFYQTMGRYIDAVFGTTIDAITGMSDIGVDDSQALSDHCRDMHSLISLFHLDPKVLESYADLLPSAAKRIFSSDAVSDELLDSDDSETLVAAVESSSNGNRDSLAVSISAFTSSLANEYCKLSDKLVQLADILVISRADIMARRRAGLLVQFAVEELVDLICALFADTPERTQDIQALRSL
ncbi:Centromere/kinetochore protein zw10 [Coemansia sp. RSA 1358]|uniref:Centromere/kinetochore protein zw10 n=1 Tax=Coemansia umbellata TaxID=1424467 RepID=A0ABQ8PME8_9FUNG|nr:Centromere/kinetochore Zw10-domain-containing protein [Coemansia spiralis]KAJ1991583.1 Centromere/kinetochore protein zw10 [Coemansia umbellata]KAJ2623943.1 Centromere/kinetochore protein zw10 [Coemansia sp. RSA 1358]